MTVEMVIMTLVIMLIAASLACWLGYQLSSVHVSRWAVWDGFRLLVLHRMLA